MKNLFGEFMNAMIKKLLQGQAVEWKTLGEVAKKISSGGTPKTGIPEYYNNGEIPWLRTQEVNFNDIYDTGVKITEQGVKNSSAKWIPANCVIIAMYGATVGRVGINKIPMTTNQACANIEVNEEIAEYRYVYYCLANQYEYIKSLGTGSQTNINAQIVKKLKIPIPPLSVQSQIVQILDTFTELTAELTSELGMRQKQYQYYRDFLLSEHELAKVGFEWKTLGEVGDILDNLRKPIKASLRLAGSNPYYGANNIQDYVDGFTHDGEYVLIAEDGSSSLENYSIQWATGKFWANNHVHVVSAKECLNNRFLFHFLKSMNFIPYLTGGTRAKLTKAKMIEIPIPIPPLSVQSQIVQILDTFDSLTNSISDGLPKEIKLRQKQYEYYREQLLNFTATI